MSITKSEFSNKMGEDGKIHPQLVEKYHFPKGNNDVTCKFTSPFEGIVRVEVEMKFSLFHKNGSDLSISGDNIVVEMPSGESFPSHPEDTHVGIEYNVPLTMKMLSNFQEMCQTPK